MWVDRIKGIDGRPPMNFSYHVLRVNVPFSINKNNSHFHRVTINPAQKVDVFVNEIKWCHIFHECD